jgi:hypothetical protein
MAPKRVLGIMRFTADMSGHVQIAAESSATLGVLTPDDYEVFLDALNDSLYLQGAEDVTIGAALARGDIEVSFSVEADSLAQAHHRALEIFSIANGTAVAEMGQRLAGSADTVAPHWTESRVSELVGT